MDRQQDTSGDYGYDLAHEAAGRPAAPGHPTGGEPAEGRPPAPRSEPTGDLEYDEAHDF